MTEARSHPDGFCRACCLLCGWCPSIEDHECFGVGEPMGFQEFMSALDDERCPGSGSRPSASHRLVCADLPALCPICDRPFEVDTTVIPEHDSSYDDGE